MHYRNEFEDYANARGYQVTNMVEGHFGVAATVATEDGSPVNKDHFTQILNHSMVPSVATVRLSYKDFHNEAITEGMIPEECSHFDSRVCQGLGH